MEETKSTEELRKEKQRRQSRESYLRNKDAVNARARDWAKANPEKRRAVQAAYDRSQTPEQRRKRAAGLDKDRNRERQRGYYAEDKEKFLTKARKYQSENAERIHIQRKAYRERNRAQIAAKRAAFPPEVRRKYRRNRNQRIKDAPTKLSLNIRETLLARQKARCPYCRSRITLVASHLDHIMPLALGGAHADENMQLLCKPCNLRKQARHPVDFAQQIGLLL